MFNGLLNLWKYPIFSVVGDEDSGGSVDDGNITNPENSDSTTESETVDDGNPPTPPAENNEDENAEINDDKLNDLLETLSPEHKAIFMQERGKVKRMSEKIAKMEKEKIPSPAPLPKKEEKSDVYTQDTRNFDPVKFYLESHPTDAAKLDIELLKQTGLSNEQIGAFINIVGRMGTSISKFAVDPIASEFREGKFSKALETFSNDEKYKFAMSKPEIKKAVESYVRNNYSPEDWNKPETIKTAYGLTLAEHPEVFIGSGKREIVNDGGIHEKGVNGSVPINSIGISNSEFTEYAMSIGYSKEDLKDKAIRKSIEDAYKARKKAFEGK